MQRLLSVDVATKTLALCVLDHDVCEPSFEGIRIRHWEVVDCAQESDSCPAKPSIAEAVDAVAQSLKRRHEHGMFDDLNHVVIETQPMRRGPVSNPRSKCLSHVIQVFFTLQGIPVTFRAPKHKFGVYAPGDKAVTKLSYAKRKRWAVDTTNAQLEEFGEAASKWRDWLSSIKKKDDPCDAFLQGCSHIYALRKDATKKRKR